jgi:hypothetical protein
MLTFSTGSEAPAAPADLPVGKNEEKPVEQNTEQPQAALLRSLETITAEHVLRPHADGTDEHATQFQLDETALRSLQQFIEEHGLTAQSMQAREEV